MTRFPHIELSRIDANPAIQIYGRRFYADQTPVEYLNEFLLVFASPKEQDGEGKHVFSGKTDPSNGLSYFPEDRIALKLFALFASSKLETRHPGHTLAFKNALMDLNRMVQTDSGGVDRPIKLLQGLFSGLVGVAGNRTWTTHTFLPVANSLLAREVGWRHEKAMDKYPSPDATWDELSDFFDVGSHNFMARGGELLFLQLANLFQSQQNLNAARLYGEAASSYQHMRLESEGAGLQGRVEQSLKATLEQDDRHLNALCRFVEQNLPDFTMAGEHGAPKKAWLGWVPTETMPEACLFAWELANICRSNRSTMQKIGLLQNLCCLQVLRSLCFQAARVTGEERPTSGFAGQYAWIVASMGDGGQPEIRKLSQLSYQAIENLLYRAIRTADGSDTMHRNSDPYDDGDRHAYKLLRKLGKTIGLVIPRKGGNMRFALTPSLVRLLVSALIPPGERISLDRFYDRIFAHFGLAIASKQLVSALRWLGQDEAAATVAIDAGWFEEELKRGGFLITLSDAVSMVKNPYGAKQ